jgi:HEAT repeat protein
MGILNRVFGPNIEELTKRKDIPALIEALEHWNTQEKAIIALRNIGELAIAPLIQALGHNNWRVREGAAIVLRWTKDARAVEALIEALQDKNPHVRKQVAAALDQIDDPRAVGPLMTAIRNRDYAVAAGAFPFFIMRGGQGTEAILIKALKKYGDLAMASCFLRCGNKELENAARNWLASHNYKVESIPVRVKFSPKKVTSIDELFSAANANDSVKQLFDEFFSDTEQDNAKSEHASAELTPEQQFLLENADQLFGTLFGDQKGSERWRSKSSSK